MGVPPLGVFAEYQPLYASHNIPTFPVQIAPGRKKPATMGYDRVGIPGSRQLALKFTEIDAFAFMAGRRTRLSIVDVDSTDESLLRDSLRRYGETRIITRTSSGGWHLWYQHNGESREIRPEAQVPVDLLGGGVVIAPPSMGALGPYQFERGGLKDLDSLRPAQNVIQGPWAKPELAQPIAAPRGLIAAGGRSDALFRHLMQIARHCDDRDTLADNAFTFADQYFDRIGGHPFTDAEIMATVRSVHHITEKGDNRFGGEAHSILPNKTRDALHDCGPDAFFLHSVLQKWSGDKEQFVCANGMADHMPGGAWTLVRFRKARQALLDASIITEIEKASTYHGAARYAWAQG